MNGVRSGYCHGDLRRALIDAGVDAARASGPEALSLRELARIVGVAPTVDGPLRSLDDDARERVASRVVEMVRLGLSVPEPDSR